MHQPTNFVVRVLNLLHDKFGATDYCAHPGWPEDRRYNATE